MNQTGYDRAKNNYKIHTENLDDGERILGYISGTYANGEATHNDFQFVIVNLVWVISWDITRSRSGDVV